MNIHDIIKKNIFTKQENGILKELDEKISQHGIELVYKYDDNLDCAKYRPSEQTIILRTHDTYPTIVHELLHAKITIVDQVPCFSEIEKLKGSRPLLFFKTLIIDITNDLHHHIFFDEFRSLTNIYDVRCFMQNTKEYENLTDYEFHQYYLPEEQKNMRDRSDGLKNNYYKNFILLRYGMLMFGEQQTQYNQIKQEEGISLFHDFFESAINFKSANEIEQAYETFFDNLLKLANK